MPKRINVLCIGGDHDGRRIMIDEGLPTFVLHNPEKIPLHWNVNKTLTTSTVKHSTYVVETLVVPTRTFYIGRPPEQSLESTLALLIQGYRGI